jgi:hypothetical protein
VSEDAPAEEVRRSLYRHPLTAMGGALMLAGGFALVVLMALDLTTGTENPYRSLVTFVGAPLLIVLGFAIFLVGVRVQIAAARRSGETVRFNFRLELTDARSRRAVWLFATMTASFVVIVAYSGFRGFEATDSVSFCADACHAPMGPQAVAHQESAHAQVGCVDCHIGPGGTSWVRAKLDGIRQLWGVMTGEYDRPIETPLEHIQSAEAVCEECHWAEAPKGEKFIDVVHYSTDEANTPWSVSLLLDLGGGAEQGAREGVHWHTFEANSVEYVATDRERQDIVWVRVTDAGGFTVVYTNPEVTVDPEDPEVEVRSFDCMDCHNRPSHVFESAGEVMDRDMALGLISPDLPFIKRVGLDLLNAPYETKPEALAAIRDGVLDYYETNYAARMGELRRDVEAAADALVEIYDKNFFPEMNTDYRVRFNNASHWVNTGCFRCHGSDLRADTGVAIGGECDTCHLIVGQGPSADPGDLATDLAGLEFRHPIDIGGLWQQVPCTQCHSPYKEY